ncbi:MAG: fadA 5 [Aeromicrobium sp.]|nr:fadA 5 [Aeromicrobium sp.]
MHLKEKNMTEAVIVAAARTPVGKRNGGLAGVHPADLSAAVLNGVVGRAGVDPAIVDDVIWGCVSQVAEQTLDIARSALLAAGWPEHVPGVTVDRQCGSSQQSVHFAVAGVVAGHYDVVVAGGVESMSRVPMGSAAGNDWPFGQGFADRYGADFPNQGLGAEMIAERWGISRQELDAFALASHARADAARQAGLFDEEIVPVVTPDGTKILVDEGIRVGGTLEKLATLQPAFKPDGVIHAGNSSQISDGASALLIMSKERADSLDLSPIARVHAVAVIGDDPIVMLSAPIPATRKVLERSGLSIDDIGTFEVNEAFASVPLAWQKEFGVDPAKINPRGGAIALGHPLGGSGGRLMTTMIHHMRANGLRYGLQTMCEGGGQANATIIEAL